ncbi:uncharacterized protein DUF4192 [Blastococcus colisei]|uniref:Uncharacterized protein DUF4192 n=1 Tax=Blastococcus colisei TaxID=1564162 RepID=A0A543PE03_9ACTN|nr:DUF4192 domain-containing protein [Blastococcus colisei]TQN42267.1 uncharacterized protein DUF4192 [Blastococcus colisei]
MDARTGRPAHPDPGRIDVRLSDLGELAASIPHLLGFVPHESVVLVSLTGPSGSRVGLTMRADIPPPEYGRALAADLAQKVLTDRPRGVIVAVCSEAPDPGDGTLPHQQVVGDVLVALAAHAVPVPDVLLVRAGRWWSYDCPDPCCAPGGGTPLPAGVTELEVAAVATGVVVEPDRSALAARIGPPGALDRSAMAAACAQAAGECADAIIERGWDAVAEESWTAVLDALARSRPGAPTAAARLTDREVARLLWGLRDGDVRDRALGLALGADAPAAEQLWTECTRRAPAPLDAAPATLLAVSSWLRGDGAMADIALTRALAGAPDYALARLLAQALAACMRPAELRDLIRRTASDRVG